MRAGIFNCFGGRDDAKPELLNDLIFWFDQGGSFTWTAYYRF